MHQFHKHFFVHCQNRTHLNWRYWNTANTTITGGVSDERKVVSEKCAQAFREIMLDSQCQGCPWWGKRPPQGEQDELQWAQRRFLLLQEAGQKFSFLCCSCQWLWYPPKRVPCAPTCLVWGRGLHLSCSPFSVQPCSSAVWGSPRGSFCTLKLTHGAHGCAGLSPADVGLGSVLVGAAICYCLGISLSLGLGWNKCTWFYFGNQE